MNIHSPRGLRRAVVARSVLVAAASLASWSSPFGGAAAQVSDCSPFSAERRVTDGSGLATQTATGLDVANNAYISSVIGEKIQVKIIGPSLDAIVPVAVAGLGQGDPDFATNYRGITFMSFSQLDEATQGEGREVYLTDNEGGGGQFKPPAPITKNRADDYASRLVLDFDGNPHLAWAQKVGEQTRVMYWNASLPGKEPIAAAMGDYPHLYVDEAGVVHLIYSRDKDLHYNSNKGGAFTNERKVTTTPKEPESAASIGGDPAGNILVAFESRHSLYYATKPPGADFRTPLLVDAGGVEDPKMKIRSRGQVTIVYSKDGDIWYVVGQSTFLAGTQRVCEHTEAVESHPSLEIDLLGNIHLSYIRDGDVYYRNTAAQPVAEFSGIPTRGEVPLTVKFGDLSSGGIQRWEWDFGDGSTSVEQNPVHTYTEPGKYTVSLRVSGPGGTEAQITKEDFIFVQDPFYTMRIPDQRVFPGQAEVWFPVITTRKDRTQGFQVMATYDPNYLVFKEASFAETLISGRKFPEFFQVNDLGTYIEVGCIYEFDQPIDPDTQYLQPGENQTILELLFDVSDGAPQGAKTEVSLVNNAALSRIFNIFIVNSFTKLPALEGSTVTIETVQPPFPRFFVRGDADGNAKVDITDAIRILNYLFLGGSAPPCLDAADVNDRGKVDISSAVVVLNYLFLGGSQPAVPFPNPGLDPTPDGLPDC